MNLQEEMTSRKLNWKGEGGTISLKKIHKQWSLKYPQAFEVGDFMAIETKEGEWRVGGARLEDMIGVTESGAEIINHISCDEIVVTHLLI